MYTIGAYEAKTRLPELLRMVEEREEEIVITRHNKPVARIVPDNRRKRIRDAIISLKELSKQIKPSKKKQSIKEMISEGRK